MIKKCLILIMVIILSSCSNSLKPHSQKVIYGSLVGKTKNEIIQLYGNPRNINETNINKLSGGELQITVKDQLLQKGYTGQSKIVEMSYSNDNNIIIVWLIKNRVVESVEFSKNIQF